MAESFGENFNEETFDKSYYKLGFDKPTAISAEHKLGFNDLYEKTFVKFMNVINHIHLYLWLFSRKKKKRNRFAKLRSKLILLIPIVMSILWTCRQKCSHLIYRRLNSNLIRTMTRTNIHSNARTSPYPGTEDIDVRFYYINNKRLIN